MKKLFLAIVGSCFMISVFAQQITFKRTYFTTSNFFYSTTDAIETTDGYIAVNGHSNNSSFINLYKIDFYGDTVWTKNYFTSPYTLNFSSVCRGADSNYVAAGRLGNDLALMKFDENGDSLWFHTYTIDPTATTLSTFTCIRSTFDSGYIACGLNPFFSLNELVIAKLNSNGDTIWTKKPDYIGTNSQATYIEQTADSGYILASTYQSESVIIAKLDVNGDSLWTHIFYKPAGNFVKTPSVVKGLPDGGYIVGMTDKQRSTMIRLDATGDSLWGKFIGTYVTSQTDITLLHDGGFAVAGDSVFHYQGNDWPLVKLTKTDSSGNVLWQRYYYFANNNSNFNIDEAFSVLETSDLGLLVTGRSIYSAPVNGQPAAFILKTDSFGNIPTTVGVYEFDKAKINVYPNPASNICTVLFQADNATLSLYDATGRLISQQPFDKIGVLELSRMNSGMYIVEIKEKDGEVIRRKMIKE